MTVGNKIKKYRKEKNLSQMQLAEITGIGQALITAYETDKRAPRLDTLQRIAAALDVSALALLPSDLTEGAVKLAPEESEVVALMGDLTQEGKQKVKDYAADLAGNPEYKA